MTQADLIRKLVQDVSVPREMYKQLKSKGFLRTYGTKFKMNQTNFIRFFRSRETSMQVKEYLVIAYLHNLDAKHMSSELMKNDYNFHNFLQVTIHNKQLKFYNPLTSRPTKAVATDFRPLDYMSGTSSVLASKIFVNEASMRSGPYLIQIQKTISYLITLVRALARWMMAQIFSNYEESEEKIGNDAKIIRGLTLNDDYRPYVKDAENTMQNIASTLELMDDPKINSLTQELVYHFQNLHDDLEWWHADYSSPTNTYDLYEDELLGGEILNTTRDTETALTDLSDALMEFDYSQFDMSSLRKNALLPSPIPHFMTNFVKSSSVRQLKFIDKKLFAKAKKNMV